MDPHAGERPGDLALAQRDQELLRSHEGRDVDVGAPDLDRPMRIAAHATGKIVRSRELERAAKESLAWQRAEAPASEKSYEQKMKDSGVTFTSPDPAPLRTAVEPFYKEYGDKINANELIKRIREA